MVHPDKLFGRLGNRLFQGAYLYAQVREGKIPDWYVQDYRYFQKYEKEIKDLFGEGIGFLPFVGIHVRRGKNPSNPDEPNYSENPFYIDLASTDYYQKALELFPGREFLVFSDDIEFCKEYFKKFDRKFQFVEGQSDVDDFNMMASCEGGNIIANSSFSFWAAFLNPSPIKKIVAPKAWYSDGKERTILPPEWIKL